MNKTIFALGFFDGIHLGHAALIRQCRTLAEDRGLQAGVVTFATHPEQVLQGRTPGLINSLSDRLWLLREQFHMDTVVTLPFDEAMRAMPWADFLTMLVERHGAAGFVCGEDFRFGRGGQGNARTLTAFCEGRGLPSAVVPEQLLDGIRISSTYIRRQLETGDMATAVRFLGHPHVLSGTVVPGQQLGRRLGIPTANLRLPEGVTIPKLGVYACRAVIDGIRYPAVTNIGIRPTVSGAGITVEPWILDYSGDLYGREIRLEFYRFLRPEERFPTLEALKQQIHRDAEQTRRILD